MTTSFVSPYADVPPEREHRTAITTDKAVATHVTALRGPRSTLQITLNILLSKLYAELNANGFTTYDPVRYERAILGATITLGGLYRGAEPFDDTKAGEGHVRPGVTGILQQSARCDHVTPVPRRSPAGKGTRKGKGGKANG